MSEILSRQAAPLLISQHRRLMQLETALPSCTFVVERATWFETTSGHASPPPDATDATPLPSLGSLSARIDCISTSSHLESKTLLGEQVSLRLMGADGHYRVWHGFATTVAHLGSDGGLARYRIHLSDFTHFLRLRRDTRVFLQQRTEAIVSSVLKAYPQANFRFELSPEALESAPLRGVTTQFRETDAAFVARLLGEEGWNWRLEHADDGQPLSSATAAKHCLVISDAQAQRVDLGALRFGRPDVRRQGLAEDTLTQIAVQRRVQPNAVTLGAWHPGQLAGVTAATQSSLDAGVLPTLEVYQGQGERLYAQHAPGVNLGEDQAHTLLAERRAALALARHELAVKTLHGQGAVRTLAPGANFQLTEHPLYGAQGQALGGRSDNQFLVLGITHEAANNLGTQATALLDAGDAEAGSYRNRFTAVPAAATLVPVEMPKPRAPGAQTALVVGHANEPITTERDLRVRIQFPWQRGRTPLAGGLSGPRTPGQEDSGHATLDAGASLWVRVAQGMAGANWGHVTLPRVGTEVLVNFVDGDIDRPMVTGQLHNAADTQPWPAGVDSGANHPGTLSGYHAPTLDGAGLNQWVVDDATSQLRMRLASFSPTSPWTELSLGHILSQGMQGGASQRGAWLGSGFYAHTQGWASLRADGLLISTTARPASYGSAQSTQMDTAEARGLLKGAQNLGQRLNEAAGPQGAAILHSHAKDDQQALQGLLKDIDPQLEGKYAGAVNGQDALKAQGRKLTDPVERFARPHLVMETPNTAAFTSPATIAAFSGMDTSLTAQDDVHAMALHTASLVSGETTSLYNHEGELKVYAANGNVSLRAHTDQLELLADKEVVVTSVNDEITIRASQRIEMVGGDAKIVLEGGNISHHTSSWTVQAAAHDWSGPAGGAAQLPTLPDSRVKMFDQQIRALSSLTGEPIANLPYKLTTASGDVFYGQTDELGKVMRVATLSPEKIQVEWGTTPPLS